MNYGDLQNEVLGHQLSDTKYRPSVKRWLNEAQQYVVLQLDVRTQFDAALYTTEADDPALAVPANFARIYEITNTNSRNQLTQITPEQYDSFREGAGTPRFFAVIGSSIYLAPTPNGEYPIRLRYYRTPAEMSDTSDEPEIPERYHHLLVRYSLIRAFQRENDYEAAMYWRSEFETDLMKMKGEAPYDTRQEPRQVSGTWGDSSDGWTDLERWR